MKVFLGTLTILSLGMTPLLASATGFTVTPMIQEVVLDQSEESESYAVTVTNATDTLATFELSVIDFGSLDASGGVAFLGAAGELRDRYALASWMRPETDEITVAPGEERSVSVQIENREDLAPGGHYGALIFKNTSPSRSDTPNVSINQMLSSLVLVKKTGGARYGLELSSLEYLDRWFDFRHKVSVRFRNTGNVHVVPRGEFHITDPVGRLVYRGILNEGSAVILPETFREYTTQLFPVKWAFFPGYYTLDFNYRYDGRDEKDIWSQQLFLFPPIPGCVLTSVGIISVILAARLWKKRQKLFP